VAVAEVDKPLFAFQHALMFKHGEFGVKVNEFVVVVMVFSLEGNISIRRGGRAAFAPPRREPRLRD
jgi:hypothetical protein